MSRDHPISEEAVEKHDACTEHGASWIKPEGSAKQKVSAAESEQCKQQKTNLRGNQGVQKERQPLLHVKIGVDYSGNKHIASAGRWSKPGDMEEAILVKVDGTQDGFTQAAFIVMTNSAGLIREERLNENQPVGNHK
jgi:hypothetical protein